MNTCTVSFCTDPHIHKPAKHTISSREGATSEMIAQTRKHFVYAKECLSKGCLEVENEDAANRADYGENRYHDEARVNIFGDAIVATEEYGDVKISINICNEYTSAQTIISAAWTLVNGAIMGGDIEANGGAQAEAEPVYDDDYSQAPPEEDASPAPPQQSQPAPVSDSGTPFIGEFNHNMVEEYEAEYGGRVVAFEVRRYALAFSKKGDKTIEAYSLYNGNSSKYPSYELTTYLDNEHLPDAVREFYEGITADGITGRWRHIVYVNRGKNGKVYFNLTKIEAIE